MRRTLRSVSRRPKRFKNIAPCSEGFAFAEGFRTESQLSNAFAAVAAVVAGAGLFSHEERPAAVARALSPVLTGRP